jgi:hypothetical protein
MLNPRASTQGYLQEWNCVILSLLEVPPEEEANILSLSSCDGPF